MNGQMFWKGIVRKGAALNPVDRISEILFGLIMVLSFTGAISVAGRQQAGHQGTAVGSAIV